jgi:glutaconate CoA-transferase subunit B
VPEYSFREMMVLVAAREIRDEDIVFCGTGISMVAAMAAKHISAPHSIIFFETGGIDSQLLELPLSVGDPRVMFGTSINAGLADSFGILENPFTGPRVVGIFGAAQIDRYGNLNTTCIGDYWRPTVRFPGCGGACDAASYAGGTPGGGTQHGDHGHGGDAVRR